MRLYHVKLNNLQPNTEYCYRVFVDNAEVAGALGFHTASVEQSAETSFIAIGDYAMVDDAWIGLFTLAYTRFYPNCRQVGILHVP